MQRLRDYAARRARPEGRVSLDIFIRQRLTCPRHPRYNPERGGEAAIRGGCRICTEILQLRAKSTAFQAAVHDVVAAIVTERQRERA
jgi:hypothetical protein